MRRLVYLAAARRDLIDCLGHVSRCSGRVATGRRLVAALCARCAELARLPESHARARCEVLPDLRSLAWNGYVIFVRYRGEILDVVTILQAHHDIDTPFTGRPLD